MKIAHFVRITPNAAGLYESTREICKGQRDLGWDARMIDVEGLICASSAKARVDTHDRDVPISNMNWAATEADIHVLHSGIPTDMEGKKPLVIWLHGLPEYAYYSQMLQETYSSYSLIQSKAVGASVFKGSWTLCADYIPKKPYTMAAVTCWERHSHFWKHYYKNMIVIPHFVDLQRFTPKGKVWDFQIKPTGSGLNILWADHWRYTAFKDPFQVVHGLADFCRETGSKLHLWAIPMEYNDDVKQSNPIVYYSGHPWNVIWTTFKDILGDLFATHGNIDEVYRAADLVVTTSCDDTRLVLESQACGTPVVARPGCSSLFSVDWNNPAKVTLEMKKIRLFMGGSAVRARAASEAFTVDRSARLLNTQLEEIYLREKAISVAAVKA